ncbi:MAG TPA: hypothetical protein VFW89_09635 [Gemmatimonadaceae bacterium]|nr:hypothetical protein [Gemmatimonadaceae bacterium]
MATDLILAGISIVIPTQSLPASAKGCSYVYAALPEVESAVG